MPNDSDFDRVPVNSFSDNLCSPDVTTSFSFEGIKIAAPERVPLEGKPDRFGSFARLIVSGGYRFPANYLGLREQFRARIVIVAVDLRSHIAYAGGLLGGSMNLEAGPSPYDNDFGLTDADFNGRFIAEYFNPNLVQLFDLPKVETDYVAYAVLGKYVSNTVRIALRK